MNAESLGARLLALRSERKLSQAEFANQLGISLRAYQSYERAEREVPVTVVASLAEQGVSIDWFVCGRQVVPALSVQQIQQQVMAIIAKAEQRQRILSHREFAAILADVVVSTEPGRIDRMLDLIDLLAPNAGGLPTVRFTEN